MAEYKYRKQGSSLLKYCEKSKAYVCVFTRSCRTKEQLIEEYEQSEMNDLSEYVDE